jgi:hypothetical protein
VITLWQQPCILPKCLKMIHGFTTPLLIKSNIMQLLNKKWRHLKTIKPKLQTCNDKITNPSQHHKFLKVTNFILVHVWEKKPIKKKTRKGIKKVKKWEARIKSYSLGFHQHVQCFGLQPRIYTCFLPSSPPFAIFFRSNNIF